MTPFILWYLFVTLLGWLTFPLVHRLFPALADRGYTLARAAGLLIWGYAFWLFVSLGIARNDFGGIFLALAIILGLSIWAVINRQSEIADFIKTRLPVILTTEILFLLAFAFLAFVRSANPELASTEKPMELAFINGILRSETFPPQDPWLSGYAISYYYFGYVITAMLARLADINGSMAHNLMTALIFALGAVGSFGIVYNLLASSRFTHHESRDQQSETRTSSLIPSALLAPVFLLLVSNFETVLEVLHRLGLGWTKNAAGEWSGPFWKWLDMKELSQPPIEPFGWVPDRYLWWWRASRVIQDYDMTGGFREVIDEFPFFSFLLGDLHPHVLAIPFGLLAVSVALNLFLGGWRGKIERFGLSLHVSLPGFFFSALVLGGLAFLNTWDILISAALIVSAYVLSRAHEDGWKWARLEDVFLLGLPLGIFSLLLYFPFYLGFSSQAGGVLPNFMFVTRGMHFWVMWGTLLLPIFSYLIYLTFGNRKLASGPEEASVRPNWKLGFSIGLGLPILLFLFALILGGIGSIVEKDFVEYLLASQNMTAAQFLGATTLRRLTYFGSLLTLLAVLIPTLAFLFPKRDLRVTSNEEEASSPVTRPSSLTFSLLLLTLGGLLVLAPEFVYLRDQFGYRINTVFKFYYQAWMLWSLVAAFGTGWLLQNLRGLAANISFRVLIGLVIFCGLLYPVFSLLTKTNNFNPVFGYNLDDFERVRRENPDDAAGIEFLRSAPEGIVAEAVGDSYSYYARVSAYTGFQTVLGWPGHEYQWRGSYDPQAARREDILTLYATPRWEEAQTVIQKYNIRYIYVGPLERVSMPVNEEKFILNLTPVFQQGTTVIYEVP